MSLQDIFFGALQAQLPDPKPAEADIRQLAQTIAERIEGETGATSLPISFVEGEIKQQAPIIQLMLAQDHSSIHNAAQHVVQVFTEDPRSIIPEAFRDEAFCPYPGLAAFDEGDARYFYGRSDDIEAFVDRLPQPLIALTGPSGVGKSSFMAAGVLHALRARYGETAVYLTFRVHANANLLDDFAAFLSEETEETAVSIAQALRQREDGLLTLLQTTFGGGSKQVFLFLDQFESLFVGEEENRARDRNCLLENLLYVEDNQQEPFLTVLLASRENFFEHSDYTSRARLAEIIQRENVSLFALSNVQLRQAIEQPLARFNQDNELTLRFQSGLVDLIVRDFRRNTAVSLPLVQYLLRLLWVEKYHLTHFAYNSLGGLEQVLDRHALAIYQSFADEDQRLVKAILLSLVRPGISGEHTRKRIRRESLLVNQEGNTQQRIEQLLRRLSDARSRIISEQQVGQVVYLELTHEIVLRQWMLLQEVIETHKERIAIRERLLPKAEGWLKSIEINGRKGDKGELYSGNELKQARQYLEAAPYGGNVDGAIVACFVASQSHRRKVFIRITAFIIVSIILVIGSVLWIQDQAEQQITLEQQRADANATAKAIAESQQAFAESQQATAEYEATIEGVPRATAEAEAEASKFEAEQQAGRATSRRLAIQANELGNQIQTKLLGLLLAIEAGMAANTTEAAVTLHTILASHNFEKTQPSFSHNDLISHVAINYDGTRLLTTSWDKTAKVWDLVTGDELLTLEHPQAVSYANWNPDETKVLTVSLNTNFFGDSVRIWDVRNGEELLNLPHDDVVTQAAWSRDGKLILTRMGMLPFEDYGVFVWDAVTGKEILSVPQPQEVKYVTFNNDGSKIITASWDKTAKVWDVSTGTILLTLPHPDTVWQAIWNKDESLIITQSDTTIQLWDARTGLKVRTFPSTTQQAVWNEAGDLILTTINDLANNHYVAQVWDIDGEERLSLRHTTTVTSAMWNEGETQILTVSDDIIHIWSATTGKELFSLRDSVEPAAWNAESNLLLTYGGVTKIWDTLAGQELAAFLFGDGVDQAFWTSGSGLVFSIGEDQPYGRNEIRVWNGFSERNIYSLHHPALVNQAIWTSREDTLITAGDDANVRLWNTFSGNLITNFAHEHPVERVTLNNDETKILTVSSNIAQVWDIETGEDILTLPHYRSDMSTFSVNHAIWNKDENQILTLSAEASPGIGNFGHIKLWDALTGEEIWAVIQGDWPFFSASWNHLGSQILTASWDNKAKILDSNNGNELLALEHDSLAYALWNKDSSKILTAGGDGIVRVWSLDGEILLVLTHSSPVNQAIWNSAETVILTASDDRFIRFWDATSGKELLSLSHDQGVKQFALNNTETHIFSITEDNKLWVWDTQSGELLLTIGHSDIVSGAAWDRSGERILVSSGQNVSVYYATLTEYLAQACSLVTRNMSEYEWGLYMGLEPYRPTCSLVE